MSIKNVKLIKGMSREVVNTLISEWLTLEDDVYLGNNYKHNWKCKCGNVFNRRWSSIKGQKQIDCGCIVYNKIEERYKYEVEKTGEYEYIRSYRSGDILPNGRPIGKKSYLKIKHRYCGSVYDTNSSGFIKEGNRCGKCCQKYENSFAYHIKVELGESLDKYWDFDKNTVNPYHIYRNYNKSKVWIKCTEKDYHGSYEISCSHFINNKRCPYCVNFHGKVHPLDSFGYKHFDKILSWHPDNKISPFRVAPGSSKKYKFLCSECDHVWETSLSNVSKGSWCPQCNSSKGEKRINSWLKLNNIEFIEQKEFNRLTGLGGGNLSYDFYLPDYNLLIEYQGEYHDGNTTNQTQEEFKKQQEHDRRKRDYAWKNGYSLLEIWYYDFNNIEEILKKELNIYNIWK